MSIFYRLFIVLFSWTIAIPITAANESVDLAENIGVKGASCVIRSNDKVVLVRESLTNKLSLPAGGVGVGETPAMAAERETWEETGLVVIAKAELLRAPDAVIYDCVADSELLAYQYENSLGGHELPIWFAPHYGVEVKSAMLVDPSRVDSKDYRFPFQLKQIIKLLPIATDQPVVLLANLVDAAPRFNQFEINALVAVKHWANSLPTSVTNTIEMIMLVGNWFANPIWLLVCFPFACWRFDKAFSYKVLFTITVTSLLSLLAQQGFSLPRPQVYIPDLGLVSRSGFNLPSLSFALWVSVGVLLFHALEGQRVNQWRLLFAILLLWQTLASFYSGTAFILDSVSGAILGGLCAWHILRLESKPEVDVGKLLTTKGVWFALLGTCVVMTVMWPTPTFVYWSAILVTVFGLVSAGRISTVRLTFTQAALMSIILVSVSFLFDHVLTLTSLSSWLSLLVEALRYPTIILVFVLPLRIKLPVSRAV